ncbi:hypothetical protein ONZ45_g16033 [Pleurotus djamor]|nr:hypothetical protein ONZ45_g16033 [Pleurotus djamor]
MPPVAPYTRERLDDPPPLFRSLQLSPKPHRTPGYAYGWRVTIEELRRSMAKYGEEYDVYYPCALRSCIKKQWKEQGYATKFGTNACPQANIVPLRRNAELEMFIRLFSNGDQELIDQSQDKEKAQMVISAARDVLSLRVLGVLPPEVIALLFQAMDNLELVMFAIANSQLFAIGYIDFVSRVAQFNAPWAYCKIILVGDDSLDFPHHLFSDAELVSLNDIADEDEDSLYTIAEEAFEHMPQRQFLDATSFSQLENSARCPQDYNNAKC